MDTTSQDYVRGAIESLLFVSDKPVMLEQIKEALETVDAADIKRLVQELKDEFAAKQRGMVIMEIAGGYQMLSCPDYAEYIRNFFKTRVKEKLSRPALETLAIIAYKQPVSRTDIEIIRGVNSDGVVTHLLEKGLIKIAGRKDVPGRPYIYGTTKQFLEYFGLKSLSDMPKLEDFPSLQGADQPQEKVLLSESNKPPMEMAPEPSPEADPAPEEALPADAFVRGEVPENIIDDVPAPDSASQAGVEDATELKKAMEEMKETQSAENT